MCTFESAIAVMFGGHELFAGNDDTADNLMAGA
jgi:hypothetical protein